MWELGWEEPGQCHHPGLSNRNQGTVRSFKATSEHGHRHQLVTGAGRGGSCVPVSQCRWGPGTEPITSPL